MRGPQATREVALTTCQPRRARLPGALPPAGARVFRSMTECIFLDVCFMKHDFYLKGRKCD